MDRLDKLKTDITPAQKEMLEKYMDEILTANRHINLTAIRDRDAFIEKHIVDSLIWADLACIRDAERIIDAGTGAGFPGVPLAVIYPDKEFVLLDSLNKKLDVVSGICDSLGINNVKALHMRAEDAGKGPDHREKYDVCVTRALAPLNVLAEYTLPLVRTGGYLVAYKGPQYEEEIKDAKNALGILGGKLKTVETDSIRKDTDHVALVIAKVRQTPEKYPRRAGTPSKKPIR